MHLTAGAGPRRFALSGLLLVGLALAALSAARAQSDANPGPDDPIADKSQELEDLRYRIRASQRKVASLAADEKTQMARLAELDHQRSLTNQLLAELEGRSAELATRNAELQADIDSLRARLVRRQSSLSSRLREMYMRPRTPMAAVVLAGGDLGRASARARAYRHIAATERSLIDAVLADRSELEAKQDEVEAGVAQIQLDQSEARQRQDELARLGTERKQALAEVRREHRKAQHTADELERAAQALEDLIARLENQRQQENGGVSHDFAAQKGTLPWPVVGQVVQTFGPANRPQLVEPIVSKGWKIRAAHGTPILAIAEGKVDFVDWLPGYGQCIIVNHGDGYYSLYAHASSVFPRVGATVAASEVIAEVGDTGSVEGSLLYLEIRKGRTPLDPARWLRPDP